MSYSDKTAALAASLDDLANDPDGENVPSTADALAGGPEGDTLTGSDGPEYLIGGPGDDTLNGLGGFDILEGFEGGDTLNGDAGPDRLQGGIDTDVMNGGDGPDTADYTDRSAAVTVTLDDAANDGTPGENDHVRADVERAYGGTNADTLTGNDGPNLLFGGLGGDTITGAGGEDDLRGSYGDDAIDSRDATADAVSCGDGTADSVRGDEFDTIETDCESVSRADPPPEQPAPPAPLDTAPSVSFTGADAVLAPARASKVTVTASDDHGIARVELRDDGVLVGTDTSAPYEFVYTPGVADIGDNTLTATAVDTGSQSASASRTVRVARFRPARVTARVKPRRDRRAPHRFAVKGAVRLPAALSRRQGCSGRVLVALRRGSVTVASRRLRLRSDCRFAGAVATRTALGRLTVTTRFEGNRVLAPRSARSVRVRAG